MSTWAEKLKKEKTEPAPKKGCEPGQEPNPVSVEGEKAPAKASVEPVVEANAASAKPTDGVPQEQPQHRPNELPTMSYVDLGPVSLPADLAIFISDEFTFAGAPTMPSSTAKTAEPLPAPEAAAPPPPQSSPLRPGEEGDSSRAIPTARSLPARRPAERPHQRRRDFNPNPPHGAGRSLPRGNPYYIHNGFGDAFFQSHMRYAPSQGDPNGPAWAIGGGASPMPPFYAVGAGPHFPDAHSQPFLDGSAAAYRPSYFNNSAPYYSGQLQPWPPYYPPQ